MAADPTIQTPQATPREAPPRIRSERAELESGVAAPSVDDLVAAHASAEQRWRRALKAANSGRPVDLAELALAQEAYVAAEAALHEAQREQSEQSRRLAEMRARRMESQSRLAVIVAQEQRWREVAHNDGRSNGLLGGLRRIFRRER